MDVFQAIRERRSIRRFRSEPIPEKNIDEILDAARWAPSAGNRQPWEFIIIRDPQIKRYLCSAAHGQNCIEMAPLAIVICANEMRSAKIYGDRGRRFYSLLDAAAAIQNMLLASHAHGLGACWIGAFDDEGVQQILNLPLDVKPIAIVPLGYPDENPEPPLRIAIHELVHRNRYQLHARGK
ncbi:MAG: nitroreductase family protein [Candidatus Bathyarchaeota archaeon]|nr:MAG: nitroreductase family protein [Candidatus Bathyarchaeota archaeon]